MRARAVAALVVLGAGLSGCFSDEAEGLVEVAPAATTVEMDFFHRPLPEIPLPNDIATRYDASSATGRRINASMIAPTALERRVREHLDRLDGWGSLMPITIPFTGPLDIDNIVRRHDDVDYDTSDDVIYLVDIDRDSPDFGRLYHLDLGNGNYPVVLENIDKYWPYDPRGWTNSLLFEEADEDVNGNGVLDPGEDANRNGQLDEGEDRDGDGALDPPEDTDADGVLDRPNYLPGHAPERDDLTGRADALMTFYERETDTLIATPLVPLNERTTYAVIVTRRLLDANGEPVGSPYPFAHHAAQAEALRPLPDVLPEGLELDDVAFAFTFTTQTLQSAWVAVRDGLYGHGVQSHLGADFPAKLDAIFEIREGGNISNPHVLYNEQWLDLVQLVAPAVFGVDERSREFESIVESQRYVDFHVMGSFTSPQLLHRNDENGVPLAMDDQSWPEDLDRVVAPARPETIYFWLTVPRREVSARGRGEPAPVVVMAHGYGSNRFESLIFNGHFARHGMAVLAIDAFGHGLEVDGRDLETVQALIDLLGFERLFDVMLLGRAVDLDNDGAIDSGADFWTSFLFHTRDAVRQSVLDHLQLVRVVRSFDGRRRWAFDLDGDGERELAGDFDADGFVDIGNDAPIHAIGGSLGGFMSTLLGSLEPAIEVIVPISGGGGLSGAGIRSLQGGVPEGFILRAMNPIYLGQVNAETGLLPVETLVVNVNRRAFRAVAQVEGVLPGDTVRLENLDNGEVGCGWMSPESTFRVAVESDRGDRHRLSFFRGPALVTGSTECELFDGAMPFRTVDTFELEVEYQAEIFDVDSPLVALESGLGIARATPELRRFQPIGQLVLDPADPVTYARHLRLEPLVYPGTGERTGTHAMIATTMGDMGVPANTGLTLGRAAGFIGYLEPDPRYGVSPNQVLIDTATAEAVHTLMRYVDAETGAGVHIDIENFSRGTDIWGSTIPRLDPPLHLYTTEGPDGQDWGGVSGSIFPYPVPEGMHGFPFPGQLVDEAIEQCEAACPESATCDCDGVETFDVGHFMFNALGTYVRTRGERFDTNLCNSRNDCDDFLPPPEPRPASELR